MNYSLSILTLVPFIGGLVVAGAGSVRKDLSRVLALGFSLITLIGAGCLWTHFNHASGQLQFVEQREWVSSLGIQYFLGVDGIGLLLVMLTAIVTPLSILVSWSMNDRPHVYHALILWLQAGLFGTFTALNFFHWFMFWELGLIPAFFLIKLWGGRNRGPAATQFFIYTMVGSVTLLLSFLALWLATKTPQAPGCFDFIKLADLARSGELTRDLHAAFGWQNIGLVVFFGAFLGFAVKVPVVPFHTWLPSAYAEAPSAVTMMLTGVMSKMGVYGFLRILLPIFPGEMRAVLPLLLWLAVATIVLSACAAFAQRDLKRVLAYSSVNHLGYCLLAMFAAMSVAPGVKDVAIQKAAALDGALLQMFNHGLTASALFLFVALLEKRSGGLRGLGDFGGLRKII
ncbi:MAG: NADH-quinone oxidoreductase subunit M, partial [Verrucomicrobiae bacterium]|nr:NADH-quinone oxidoreductase subunit M [Verrucomicrobiae bacterium]